MSDATNPREQFDRTECGCELCQVPCRHMPGSMIPGDLERIADHCGVELGTDHGNRWVEDHFRASEGAAVADMRTGQAIRIPSMVPANRPNGECVFLDSCGGCSIHKVSPYGCSHHDMHMDKGEADKRSKAAVGAQIKDAMQDGEHTTVIAHLHSLGLTAPKLSFRRERLDEHVDRLEGTPERVEQCQSHD